MAFSTGDIFEVMADEISRCGGSRHEIPLDDLGQPKIGFSQIVGVTVVAKGGRKSNVNKYTSLPPALLKRSRRDGNKIHLCECGCGFATANGRAYLKRHETIKIVYARISYPPDAPSRTP